MGRGWASSLTFLFVLVLSAGARASPVDTPLEDTWSVPWRGPTQSLADTPEPPEPPAALFGDRGQFMVTAASSAGVTWETFSGSEARVFSVGLSPGLDYFLWKNVSVGVSLGASYGDNKGYGADGSLVETTTTNLSGGPRVGLNVPLSRAVSFYPRLTVGLEWVRTQQSLVSGTSISVAGSPLGYPTTTRFGPSFDLYLPLLFHLVPHFFVGGGPFLFHDGSCRTR
jgi:hypothetical protein